MKNRIIIGLLVFSLFTVNAKAADSAEQQIIKTMASIQNMRLNDAIQAVTNLTQKYPNYRAAQLLKANLLKLKSGQNIQLIPHYSEQDLKLIKAFNHEVAIRWQFQQQDEAKMVNQEINQAVVVNAKSGYFVMINAKIHRLFLYQQTPKGFKLVDDFYVSIAQKGTGKQLSGDLKTPIGIYWINAWKPDRQLPDLYGAGALTLNYPNAWDKQQGKTGHGIWLHGTPSDTYTRPPLTSKGCVVLSNDSIKRLHQKYQIAAHTPVMIFNELPKLSQTQKALVKQQLEAKLKKNHSNINWKTLTILAYPDEKNLFYITYQTQDGVQEEDFWHQELGQWQSLVQNKIFSTSQTHQKISS